MHLTSFDIETWGQLPEYALQPCRARAGLASVTSAAFITNTEECACLSPSVDWLREQLRHCANAGSRIVAWNAPFDVAWMIALGLREEVFANKWLDAMLLWRHLTVEPTFKGKTSYSLKAAVPQFLPEHAGYEKDIDFDPAADPEKLLAYNIKDARFTLQLAQKFWDEMPDDMRRVALVEAACIPLVAESHVNGLRIDGGAAHELDAALEADANVAFVNLKLDDPNNITPEVLASPAQLTELLFEKWKLGSVKATPKGKPSTDKDALAILAEVDARAALIHEYREAKNNRTKFVTSTLESVEYNGDGFTRPQFRIYGTYTGRGTYSASQGRGKQERQTGVAVHQWKRAPEFRKLIVPPEDYTLLEFDFAGQEFRWMAVCSGDSTMLKMCEPGQDAHAFMGARIANIPYEQLLSDLAAKHPGAKDRRQLGKVANLSLQYRTSAGRLQSVAKTNYGLDITPSTARSIHATYQTTYRAVPRYWDKQIYLAKSDGYISNLAGRRVQLGRGDEWARDLMWSYESTAINFPIQSIGADQKYLALLVLRNYLPKVDGKFYLELHDGLFVVVPDKYADRAVHEIKQLLSNLPYEKAWQITLPIQFPVDAKIGKSWGDLQEIKE